MYPISDRFASAVQTSHRAYSWVEIMGGDTIDGVVGGEVNLDSSASVRGSISFTIVDPEGIYIERGRSSDLLSRFGSEVRAWRGVVLGSEVEAVPLGVFRVEGNPFKRVGDGWEIQVTGRDRSSLAARKSPRPLAVANGTPVAEALASMIRHMVPGASLDLIDTPQTTSTMLLPTGSDVWEQAVGLAAANGMVLYVDRLGVFRTSFGLSPDDPIVWMFDEGERCTFTEPPTIDRGTAAPTPNGFIVTGSASGSDTSGVYGEAWDLDPSSPTYRYGRYGENAEKIESDKVKTNAQAQAAAEYALREALGRSSIVNFSAVCNPALDPYDICWVRRTGDGLDEAKYLASHRIPLSPTEPSSGVLGRHDAGAQAGAVGVVDLSDQTT